MISSRVPMTDDYQTTLNNSNNYTETNSLKQHLFITQCVESFTTLTFHSMGLHFSAVDSSEASFNFQAQDFN